MVDVGDGWFEAAKKEFLRVANDTAHSELGLFVRDDGNGEFTFDGVFNFDKALREAIEEYMTYYTP